jgi:hypothetical protein
MNRKRMDLKEKSISQSNLSVTGASANCESSTRFFATLMIRKGLVNLLIKGTPSVQSAG